MPTSPCSASLLLVLPLLALLAVVVRGEPHNASSSSSWLLPAPFASKRRFTHEKLINAGDLNLAPQGGGGGGGPIAAWLDWNGDQHLDLVRLSADQRSLAVHLWDSVRFQYNQGPHLESDLKVIKSVVPGDYNFDGKIDLLVLGSLGTGGWWGGDDDDEDRTEMRIHLQQPDGSIGPAIPIADDNMKASLAHPIPFDGTGDMRTDLIGFARTSEEADEQEDVLRMWRNVYDPANGNGSSLFSL
jgi:integrin alpha FG-GAP repeat containing protein 1